MILGMTIPPAPWTLHKLGSESHLGWLTDAKGSLLIPYLWGDPAFLRLLEAAPQLLATARAFAQDHPASAKAKLAEAWVRYVEQGGLRPLSLT